MMKWIKDFASLRLVLLLWLFAIGEASVWADDTSSSGSNAVEEEEEFVYDFEHYNEILAPLSSQITDLDRPQYKTVTLTVNSFKFTIHNCLRGSSYLAMRTDNFPTDPAYVQGSMAGTMTKVIINKRNIRKTTISVIQEAQDGSKTTVTGVFNNKGDCTIEIPTNKQIADAKSITIQADDARLDATSFTIKRKKVNTDLHDPWILFKTLNGDASKVKTFPTDDNSADANEAYVGQIIQLESNGIEGFDPVSTMSNPYVVTYNVGTTDEDTPDAEFSNVMDGKKTYWKNGNDLDPSGNAIGKNGIVYRRGIVLGIDKDSNGNLNYHQNGDVITVKVGIFKVTANADGTTSEEEIKKFTKHFKLKTDDDGEHEQPLWTANYNNASRYDMSFTPETKMKTTPQGGKYDTSMTIMDPTQPVTVATTRYLNQDATLIAKFSKNDDYNVQELLNAHSVHQGVNSEVINSTQFGLRKLTGMQYTKAGIASQTVAQGFYWYVPTPKQLFLEISEATNGTIDLDITTGKDTGSKKLTLRAYYYETADDISTKKYVDLSIFEEGETTISFSDGAVANLDGDITIDENDKTTATFTVKGLDNGMTQMTVKTAKKQNANNVNYDTETASAISYMAAQTSVNVSVSGGGNLMPPSITPYSQNYSKTFKATIKGYTPTDGQKVKFYYLLTSQDVSANMSLTSTREADSQVSGSEHSMTPKQLRESVEGLQEAEEAGTLDDIDKKSYPAFGILEGNGSSVEVNIPAYSGAVYSLFAAAFKVDAYGNIITKTETTSEGDDQTTEEVPDGSRVIWSDYTYNTLEAPVLTPGYEGENHFYSFSGTLKVEAEVETDNCLIFYTDKNDDFKFEVNEDGTFDTNCYRYTSENGISINRSTTIRAIAYNPELGITSDIVTYRYAFSNDNLENVTFHISDINDEQEVTSIASGGKYTQSLIGKQLSLHAIYWDADEKENEIGGAASNVDWENNTYHIYYTTDGTFPTTSSEKYTGPIDNLDLSKGNIQIHALVYADGKNGDNSVSDVSVLYLLSSSKDYWETTTENCPNGVLTNKEQAITKDGETVVNIEFGGKDAEGNNMSWQHYASGEYGTGDPIDNVGYYTIAPANTSTSDVDFDADVRDEAGNLWNHSKSNDGTSGFQTHKATFGLPASGAYVKFEPKKSGKLTIWCCQEGALYYNNKSSQQDRFNEGFLRKRPAYFVDEAGKSIKPAETPVAAGVLSSNWVKRTTQGSWNKKGDNINGIEQKLYTQEQTSMIYEMFNEKILATGTNWNEPIQPLIVYLNTEKNKKVAGFNVAEDPRNEGETEATKAYATDNIIDETGVCLPSASYMKYTFDVKAGKTYFFFGWMTKIGIRGFGFEPSTEASLTDDVKVYSGNSATSADGSSNDNHFTDQVGKTYEKVTLQRAFKANTWTTLVLPFSVSASEVKKKFGEDTEILHYRTIENRTMYFFQHFHQMIVAGTPILIKPAKEITEKDGFITFDNVTIESATVTDTPCNDYGYVDADGNATTENTTWKMKGSYGVQHVADYNYYINNAGKVKRLVNNGKGNDLNGTRAYIVGTTGSSQTSELSMAKAAYNNLIPESMDSQATDIDFIDSDEKSSAILVDGIAQNAIYSIDGKLIGKKGAKVNRLAKGIYLVKGKKVVIR